MIIVVQKGQLDVAPSDSFDAIKRAGGLKRKLLGRTVAYAADIIIETDGDVFRILKTCYDVPDVNDAFLLSELPAKIAELTAEYVQIKLNRLDLRGYHVDPGT